MHRGTVRGRSVTRIGNDCLIMGNCHVAHDCIVGNNVIMAQTATIGGHVQVGDFAFLGGLAGVHQHGRVGRYAFVGASALMTTDLIPFGSAIGNHAHLGGLNVVGLKRRGFTREQIHDLRAAYRLLFAEEGTFQERHRRLRRRPTPSNPARDGDRRVHPRRRRASALPAAGLTMAAGSKLGMIAGGGELPVELAEHCAAADRPYFVARLTPYADAALDAHPGADNGLGRDGRAHAGDARRRRRRRGADRPSAAP